jgi:hypothetical protein
LTPVVIVDVWTEIGGAVTVAVICVAELWDGVLKPVGSVI